VLADCELEENDDTPDGETEEAIKDGVKLPTLPEAADDVVGRVVTNDELEAPAEVTPEVGIPDGILAIETEDGEIGVGVDGDRELLLADDWDPGLPLDEGLLPTGGEGIGGGRGGEGVVGGSDDSAGDGGGGGGSEGEPF